MQLSEYQVKDQQIFRAVREGDVENAASTMIEAYQANLYEYCARLVGPSVGVMLSLHVFAEVLRSLDRLPVQMTLRAMLFKLARVSAFSYQQRVLKAKLSAPADFAAQHNQGAVADPELHQALLRLDPAVREVVQLLLWYRFSPEEISAITGRTKALVQQTIGQALNRLATLSEKSPCQPS